MGHGRRDAALELGCDAPVDYQDFESEDEELAVLVADNVIPELADMDDEILRANRELIEAAGFDLEIIGFPIDGEANDPKEKEINLSEEYAVEIRVKNEEEQRGIFEELMARGFQCRVLTL
jgi:ParB-like chromosome segregation protein Spo0J